MSDSPAATPTDDRVLDVDSLVVPPAADELPAAWHERFVIGYGAGTTLLGTSPGGDSGTLDIGPEYGAPAPDGSWWFLDAAKTRIAHYDSSGQFLDQVRIPRGLLVDGRYFQWQLPHVLADGTLVAARQDGERTWLLRVDDGTVDEIPVDGTFAPAYDDGVLLYGFADSGATVAVDPTDGSLRVVSSYRTPSGARFSISLGRKFRLDLPDAGTSTALPIVTASGAAAHVGHQVRAGADGTLHLFLVGAGEDDESVQLVGATVVSRAGGVAEVEALPDPFSEADPGSPAQLAMASGSSTPNLVYVLDDGVHVYERTG
ncbi:hypothetical protein F0U44_17805 [Nocardioides humilatus]|uniref:DUF7485 domain-containing protein n=1 Tax=Nocardioides humilatus TaxID=2607660 RepID=A0A5B1L8I5_9ACTN|nr:hypothetical protein [Nocardioides humilatus]KAA1417031.1 hypothetical protein F0U44_17805 [Nocardioides humilatus]